MSAKVSVIVTNYNLGRYLPEALDSVKAQTFKDWECIIVDDGSTDGSREIIKPYIDADDRFSLLELENGGVVKARNAGIASSKGQYLLPLDADDWIEPDYLEEAVRIIESNPEAKIVYGLAECFGEGIKPQLMDLPVFSMEMMLARNCIHVSSLFRREDFDRTGGFSKELSGGLEDWDLWLGVLEKGGTAIRIDRVMLHYRMRKESRNKQIPTEKMLILRKTIWSRHKSLFSKYFMDPTETQEYRRLDYSYKKVSKFPTVRFRNAIVSLVRKACNR